MAKIYVRKIREEEINPSTGIKWTIGDVPARWQVEVQVLLDGNERPE